MNGTQSEFTGIITSEGIAIGEAYFLDRDHLTPMRVSIDESEIDSETRHFKDAVNDAIEEIKEIRGRAGMLGEKHLYLLDTQILLLQDELLMEDTIRILNEEKVNVEWAFNLAVDKCVQLLMKTGNEYLKERRHDIEQVKNKVLMNLAGLAQENLTELKEPVILIARDLQPSDIVQIDKTKVLGLLTEVGGGASHMGIMASALEIPAIAGLSPRDTGIKNGAPLILDGFSGRVFVNPSPRTFKEFLDKQQRIKYYEKKLRGTSSLPSETKDGVHVKLLANIEYSNGVDSLREFGADGVGLFRTEYLFMNRDDLPDEEEQFEEYKKVAEAVSPGFVIIRTMDLGGDKRTGNIELEEEKNPALGLRAIRFSLLKTDMFKDQLKAILRAGCYGKIKIMFPMISGVDELREARGVLEETKEELRKDGVHFNADIPVGIMIETPSSAGIADLLARESDFFSIGTNDLIQYALAVDRGNKAVAYLYKPLHPAILRMIENTIREANKAGIKVGICGEMGGNAINTMLLLGLGKIDEFSMDSHSIPKVKKLIRSITVEEARAFTKKVMSLGTSGEVEELLYRTMLERFPDDFAEGPFRRP